VDPHLLVERLDHEESAAIRRALCLCLGEYALDRLSESERDRILERAWQVYREDPDPGLHGAAQWLLGKLGQRDAAARAASTLAETEIVLNARPPQDRRRWYVTSQGQTMVVIRGDRFLMGSLATDPDREEDEILHTKQISRTFAIAATETTLAQYERFQQENAGAEMDLVNNPELRRVARSGEAPIAGLTWYEAAAYCNWLSAQEGISEDQWCYERNAEGRFGPGMRAKPNYLSLTGYRLPTGAEWEYACRAGSTTVRYYGQTKELLAQYAWYSDNAQRQSWPVARLKPSDFGLFDMYGNVWEWCHDLSNTYAETAEDVEGRLPIAENEGRVLRGGSRQDHAYGVRSADRNADPPESRNTHYGCRVTRTCPPSLR
jgi:formylglycine-generating enzyme required for sulfatase activity